MSGRFVILEHDHPLLHWDLLLENGSCAATWRLLQLPAVDESIPCERLPDHRLFYLNYEGPVSGNRGTVRRVHAGDWCGEIGDQEFSITLTACSLASAASLHRSESGAWHWTFHS